MHDEDPPVWDPDLAFELTGAEVLVGITHRGAETERYEQMFGIAEIVDRESGIAIRLSGKRRGELYWLPPDLRSFRKAAPGSYRLRSTGEVVVDPDFVAKWIVHLNPKAH